MDLGHWTFLQFGKYFWMVAGCGFLVEIEKTIINNAEMITIGTTGMKPKTAVTTGVRERTSVPPIE